MPSSRFGRFGGVGPDSSPSLTTMTIVLATIAAAVYLASIDKISGDLVGGLLASIIGGVLVRSGVAQGSKATADPPPHA